MKGMSTIVRTVTSHLVGLILLVGLWLVLYGHLSPGGGFPGGVVIAAGFILVMLAYGKERAASLFPRPAARVYDSVGALAFLLLALLGLWSAEHFFFENFIQQQGPGRLHEVFNAGIIPLANVAIALKVSMSLVVAFGVIAACRLPGGGPGSPGSGGFESDEEE